jgi:hypothetical protein
LSFIYKKVILISLINPISNKGGTHQIAFSTTDNGTHATPAGTAYTTGVTSTGTPGSAGAKTTFNVAPVRTTGAPLLFYYCTAHSGMGNTAQTISPTSEYRI